MNQACEIAGRNPFQVRPITDKEFYQFKTLIYEVAGISMAPGKKNLVMSRLTKRLVHYGLKRFDEYYALIHSKQSPDEFQIMVDLLTTNETYFFREPQHFDYLIEHLIQSWKGDELRIWSAACSSGEEVYTLAMVLAKYLTGKPWYVLGSDISTKMLASCKRGVYPISRMGSMNQEFLHKYCLRGVREQEGTFLVDSKLRNCCQFEQINLTKTLPNIGLFDVIFIRNVMIYFDQPVKRVVVDKLIQKLKPGGYLITSHSETLHGITDKLTMIKPSIHQKKG
ncbi:SAM-dependent methyltransferase [Motilimonas cestriensis]|uniref:Chemotaxis protein methyltransferase n=1 Tax=Motilimonas cestriensis TaxID=2742685 RepID=A0ABS8W655_9GAMM|nr:SAM-dependent methyltransferase [Motilimonas cestriensis]